MTVTMSAMMRNNPAKKTMLKVDYDHDGLDDHHFCIGILRMTGQVLSVPLRKLLAFRVFTDFRVFAASSLIGLHDCV